MFNWRRFFAILRKEFYQIKRDPATLSMLVIAPMMQLLLFGYAINLNARNMPTALLDQDRDMMSLTIDQALVNSRYFAVVPNITTQQQAEQQFRAGKLQFAFIIPPNFSRAIIHGDRPSLLLEVDDSDPSASGSALQALNGMASTWLQPRFKGILADWQPKDLPYQIQMHNLFNPEQITAYSVVPGLLGVVMTISLLIITALGLTREKEVGTYEILLATPVGKAEVLLGKILPYLCIGYMQITIVLLLAKILMSIPIVGSPVLFLLCCAPFVFSTLAIGMIISTRAKTQMQASSAATIYFLPSLLLSGFMFPFRGMPEWAQLIGSLLPLTHFVRIARGIMLKGASFIDLWQEVGFIVLFCFVAMWIAMKRYQQHLG